MTEPTNLIIRKWLEDYYYVFGTRKEIAILLLDRLEAAEQELKLETVVRKQAVSDLNDMTKVAKDQTDKLTELEYRHGLLLMK